MKAAFALLPLLQACAPAPSGSPPLPPVYDPTPSVFDGGPVRVNKLGWTPRGPQRAVVVDTSGAPRRWSAVDPRGQVVRTGWTTPQPWDEAAGALTQRLEVEPPLGEGVWRLQVEGVGERDGIRVDARLYAPLASDALQFFTLWRAGLDTRADDCAWSPHGCAFTHGPAVPMDAVAREPAGEGGGTRDVSGGWLDAGDFGKYVPSGAFAMQALLAAHELYPRRFADADGSHPSPESGNGRNDLLDEVVWEATWLLRMQDPDGGEEHKVHGVAWPHGPLDPAALTDERRLQGASSEASLDAAAALARTARLLDRGDPLRDELLAGARRGWAWAEAHPDRHHTSATPDDPGGGDYPFDGGSIEDERMAAAAELWLATREAGFRDALLASPALGRIGAPDWRDVGFWGTSALVLQGERAGLPPEVLRQLRSALFAEADRTLEVMARRAFAEPVAEYAWGSNGFIASQGAVLAVAARVTDDPAQRANWTRGAAEVADHLLGANALDYSFVTGVGPRRESAHNPTSHWLQKVGQALPGLLVGGPNALWVDDPWTPRDGPPARRYADVERAWCSNEIAVNWNASLVLLLVFLDEETGGAP